MDQHSPPLPAFPGPGSSFVTPTRSAAICYTRFATRNPRDGIEITMPAEDAFVIVFQLQEHPAHDFWVDGRFAPAEAAPRGTLNIVDLKADPRAQSTEPIDKLMFHLPRPALDEIAEDAGSARIDTLSAPLGWRTPDAVVARFEWLLLAALDGRETNRLMVDHILLGLAAHFAQTYGGMRPGTRVAQGGLAPWQERRAKELMSARLSGDVSVQEVASECGLSPSHFARAFKASTGMPPSAWFQARRLDAAKRFMMTSSMPLAEVALACGFADQSHFTRTFTRAFGLSPGRWKRLQS